MDFSLGEDRQALVDILGRLLRERYSITHRRAAARDPASHDVALWRKLSEIGVIGALFGPEKGGFGGSPFDILAIFEALGRALASEPLRPVLMAGSILSARDIELVIAGERILALGLYEPQSRYDWREVETRATPIATGWRLEGQKSVVFHAEAADAIIISARDENDRLSLFLVPLDAEGVDIRAYPTIDGQRAADIRLTAVTLSAAARVGGAAEANWAIAMGTLAICAEALGVMSWLHEATLEYLRTRVQFGAPIGRNQALQHRMAELLVEIEQARSAVINAAAALSDEAADYSKAIAAAKYTIGVTATRVGEEAIQMHGGIGMTEELDVSHYAKRAIMIDHELGDADHHLAEYMALADA